MDTVDTLEGLRRTVGVGREAHPGDAGPVGGRFPPGDNVTKGSKKSYKNRKKKKKAQSKNENINRDLNPDLRQCKQRILVWMRVFVLVWPNVGRCPWKLYSSLRLKADSGDHH